MTSYKKSDKGTDFFTFHSNKRIYKVRKRF